MRFQVDLISKYRGQLYGLAILWVVFYHGLLSSWLVIDPRTGPFMAGLNQWIRIGDIGVDVFLLLSGMSLYFAMEKKPTLGHFMYRRLIRLYLPYVVICVWFFAWDYLIVQQAPIAFGVNMTMGGLWVFGQLRVRGTWYIGGILACYFLYPFIHTFMFSGKSRHSALIRCLFLMAIAYLLAWGMHKYNLEYFKLVDTMVPRFPVFIFGCLLGKYVYEHKQLHPVIGWAGIAVCFVVFYSLRINPGLSNGTWYFRLSYLSAAVSLCYLGASLMALIDKLFGKAGQIAGRPLRYLGTISLELYLSSQMLRWTIGTAEGGDSSVWIWVTAMIGAVVFAGLAKLLCDKIRPLIDARVMGLPAVGIIAPKQTTTEQERINQTSR